MVKSSQNCQSDTSESSSSELDEDDFSECSINFIIIIINGSKKDSVLYNHTIK